MFLDVPRVYTEKRKLEIRRFSHRCSHKFDMWTLTNWSIQIAKIAKDRSRKMNGTMVFHNLHQASRAIDSTCRQRQCNPKNTSTPSTSPPPPHHAAKYSSWLDAKDPAPIGCEPCCQEEKILSHLIHLTSWETLCLFLVNSVILIPLITSRWVSAKNSTTYMQWQRTKGTDNQLLLLLVYHYRFL